MVISLTDALRKRGYTTRDSVSSAEELMARHATRIGGYDLYAMDVNLGNPGGFDFSIALRMYELISPVVESGLVKFYPASSDPRIVEAAKREGLPAITKQELEDSIYDMPVVKRM